MGIAHLSLLCYSNHLLEDHFLLPSVSKAPDSNIDARDTWVRDGGLGEMVIKRYF